MNASCERRGFGFLSELCFFLCDLRG